MHAQYSVLHEKCSFCNRFECVYSMGLIWKTWLDFKYSCNEQKNTQYLYKCDKLINTSACSGVKVHARSQNLINRFDKCARWATWTLRRPLSQCVNVCEVILLHHGPFFYPLTPKRPQFHTFMLKLMYLHNLSSLRFHMILFLPRRHWLCHP